MSQLWKEAKSAEGRTYYYNTQTRATSWEKPEGFGNAQSPAVPPTPAVGQGQAQSDVLWKEAKTPEGRSYYYNTVTKETTWTTPESFVRQQQNAQPTFVAGGGGSGGRAHDTADRRADHRDHSLPQKPRFDSGNAVPWEGRQEQLGFRGPMPAKMDEPLYGSYEEAEKAFFKMLERHNIPPATPWSEALRVVVKDKDYRAIKDARDRKHAYEKYVVQAREQEKTKEKERRERLREDFRKMLSTHDDIKHYTRWKSAKPIIEREAVYRQVGDDDDLRRQLFDEYIIELRKRHIEQQAEDHKSAILELEDLLAKVVVDANTAWSTAQAAVADNDRFMSDNRFKALSKLDMLATFDRHIKSLDRLNNETRQQTKRLRDRKYRKARDDFIALLEQLKQEGKIKAGVKWMDILPLVEKDNRYDALLGTPGSSPLDLFWDMVEKEERQLRSKRNEALDVLEDQRYEMTVETTLAEFEDVMMSDERTGKFARGDYALIYDRLREKILKRAEEDKKDAERHHRKAVDALRSVIKHLDPPIRADDRYEDIEPRLQKYPEFKALDDDDEAPRAAFEKHLRRVRERDDDERRRREDRDRAREYRNGDRDRRQRTRTPEFDAYEADRRKAQADRERHYRGASSFGLSPPSGERRRDDRYDDRYDRDSRRHERHESIYDRERRQRELEREKNYIDRADPRDKGRSLDYGDEDALGNGSRPGSVRKRRESDDGSMASRKRSRRGNTPEPMEVDKEEPALQSGSEEGEIEEV